MANAAGEPKVGGSIFMSKGGSLPVSAKGQAEIVADVGDPRLSPTHTGSALRQRVLTLTLRGLCLIC